MTPQELTKGLEDAFGYTMDNNRDLLNDPIFPLSDVVEELEVQKSYQFLISYIARNEEMIKANLENQ